MIRQVSAALAALIVALFVTMGTAQVASAHSDSFQSVPADDSTVTTPVVEIQFTFVEPVQQELNPEVVLVNQDGTPAQLGTPTFDVTGATMTVPIVTGALPNGDYTASYRIVSQDGHPASGELFFTVEGSDADPLTDSTATSDDSAIATAEPDQMVTSSGETSNSQLQLALGLGAAGAVALAAVLVIVALRRRRNSSSK